MRATINYVTRMTEKPRLYRTALPQEDLFEFDPREVEMEEMSTICSELDLDVQGFDLFSHKSEVLQKVKRIDQNSEHVPAYYRECEKFLRWLLKVENVTAFNHEARFIGEPGKKGALHRVHVDWTERTGRRVAFTRFPNSRKQRIRLFNIWRPMNGPIYDNPLAVCDCRTTKPKHLVATDLVFDDFLGENYSVLCSPYHKWYYVEGMRPEDCLIFKSFDTKQDVARFTPHTAFTFPNPPANVVPRQSIEVRLLVIGE